MKKLNPVVAVDVLPTTKEASVGWTIVFVVNLLVLGMLPMLMSGLCLLNNLWASMRMSPSWSGSLFWPGNRFLRPQ